VFHTSLACLLNRIVSVRSDQLDVMLYDPMIVLVLTLYRRLDEGDQE
jgi:hypothetical protein